MLLACDPDIPDMLELELPLSRFMVDALDPDVLLVVSLAANAAPDASAIQQSAAAIGVRYVFIG